MYSKIEYINKWCVCKEILEKQAKPKLLQTEQNTNPNKPKPGSENLKLKGNWLACDRCYTGALYHFVLSFKWTGL